MIIYSSYKIYFLILWVNQKIAISLNKDKSQNKYGKEKKNQTNGSIFVHYIN